MSDAKDKKMVSEAIVRRLPRYLRLLERLKRRGYMRVSSKELGDMMGTTASQIRQDFNNFGGFGQQGYGYNVETLHSEIARIIGVTRNYNLIIIGAGNIGRALANYTNFEKHGFVVCALFDPDPLLVGKKVRGIPVYDFCEIEKYIDGNDVDIAVLSIPSSSAAKVMETLVKKNVTNIWNFTAEDINMGDGVVVENVHLMDSLMSLTYRLNENRG